MLYRNIRIPFVFTLIIILALADSCYSQWRGNVYGVYGFDDKIEARADDGQYFQGDISGTLYYGAGIEYFPSKDFGVELLYFREDTEVNVKYTYNLNLNDTVFVPGLGMNFIMLGGTAYTKPKKSPMEFFGGAMLGIGIFENKDPLPGAQTSSTVFAYGFRAGANIWISESFGLKLTGQALSGVKAFSSGFYSGTAGTGSSINPESSMFQFGLGGGLVFKFGK
ncbi:MAG: hypothetical protein K1X85_14755 [Ignavibacteria bacterium]|nr:hypothetical protein [Ignavibacteria bacterium]